MKAPTFLKLFLMVIAAGCLVAGPLAAQDTNGWYLRADAGPAFVQNINATSTDIFGNTTSTKVSFDTGVRLDVDCGYQIDRCWAVEGEVGYIDNHVKFSNSSETVSPFYQVPFLVNGLYTLPVDWRIKPYAGLGAGLVFSELNNSGDVTAAGQAIAGAKCSLGEHWEAGLAYRFLATSSHNWNGLVNSIDSKGTLTHSVVATVGFKF